MHTISLAQSALASDPEAGLVLESLLEIADSVITYRRRHFAQAQLLPTLLLLLRDGTNPRSLEFQLNVLSEHATHLPVDRAVGGAKRESELITRLLERLNQADFAALIEAYAAGEPAALEQLFDSLHAGLWSVSESLAHHYFTHTASQVSELVL